MRILLGSIFQLALLLVSVSVQAPWVTPCLLAAEAHSSATSPSLTELEQGISDRIKRVDEFRFIEQEATKLGVRAWLFGGTAAGYAHYVKWDMQREKGDPRFQPDRFDYDYVNIYRSTQDLDIVIDGTHAQAIEFQNRLTRKYSHLQGEKTAWEVRLLTQDIGDKQAILNSPDFMNQHTDSNSTGMIEITKPKDGESVVRDVRGWNSKEPNFLKDVHDGALHYYFSPLHETTRFAKEGRNPPILSAIRYLTKAFQYELALRPEDLIQIKKVIDDFDPKRGAQNSYVSKWIEKNGKKLIQNAVNIEYAWDTLERLGLRNKLIAIRNDTDVLDSLSWWMNKEPLRTQALGKTGKTARELGIDTVAHETNNFLSYESITRAHTGDPNVLISRDGAAGEAAVSGDGFYTKIGRQGARGTGFAIRFQLDPNSREGFDFIRAGSDFVVIKNKAAIKVIPESLDVDLLGYFRMSTQGMEDLDGGNRGLFEKMRLSARSKGKTLSNREEKEIVKLLIDDIRRSTYHKTWNGVGIAKSSTKHPAQANTYIFDDWLGLPISNRHPEVLEEVLKKSAMDPYAAAYIFLRLNPDTHAELVAKLIQRNNSVRNFYFKHRYSFAGIRFPHSADMLIAKAVLPSEHWENHPELLEALLNKKNVEIDRAIATDVLSLPQWRDHPELRRLSGGAQPTVQNLRAALQTGQSMRASASGLCFLRRLVQFLK